MAVIVPSATPPQFDSVGPCVTKIPSSVAASTSTSSVPMVYLATMRSRSELSMIARLMGAFRMEVPMRASHPLAMPTISASLLPCGVSQEAFPRISSHPFASRVRCVSGASFTGAKMNTLASLIAHTPSNRVVTLIGALDPAPVPSCRGPASRPESVSPDPRRS